MGLQPEKTRVIQTKSTAACIVQITITVIGQILAFSCLFSPEEMKHRVMQTNVFCLKCPP